MPDTTYGVHRRILYSAIDQAVPAAHGGSVHVTAVAEGLARLGHTVEVLVSPGDGGALPTGNATWVALSPPRGNRRLRLLRAGQVLERARAFKPDVVIERYYNFGGEGVLAARKVGARVILEVNAPIVDHPGSMKRVIDRFFSSNRCADGGTGNAGRRMSSSHPAAGLCPSTFLDRRSSKRSGVPIRISSIPTRAGNRRLRATAAT